MAQALVIQSWCDVCLEAGEQVAGVTFHVDVAHGEAPAPFVVELCEEHGAALADAVAALVPLGRAPGKDTATRTALPTLAAGTGPVFVCPACGLSRRTVGSLRHHARKEHDASLAGVGFYPANVVCPTCGDGFPNRQGMAAHARTAHVKQTA